MPDFNPADALPLLTRFPAVLNSLLRALPDLWTMRNEGGESWSPHRILAHLIHAENTAWIPRVRFLLEYGESKPFDPIRRASDSEGDSLTDLLDRFAAARAESLSRLRALDLRSSDFERRGTHPKFGTVTLGQLLATWTAHDLNHLHQISRVMAVQYRDLVGPWTAFLGVMKCDGHSDAG
jgi:hypothetical protein